MARSASTFRQTDLKRAIKGATAAGFDVARIEINRDGVSLIVVPGKLSEVGTTQANEWDEVLHGKAPEIR